MSLTKQEVETLNSAIRSALFICARGCLGAGTNTQNRLMAPVTREKFHHGQHKETDEVCLKEAAELVIDVHTVLLAKLPRQDLEQIWKARAARLTSDYDIEIRSGESLSQSQ
jgi:hypothetical protein